MAQPAYVTVERKDAGIIVLTLDNPPLNLNTLKTLDRIRESCAAIAADPTVRVAIVTGSGDRAFCAGSDVTEFAVVRDDVVSHKLSRENAAFTAIEELPVPVIAALNGVTLGGGAEIALACDIRILDERARIGFPECKLGVFPGSGGVFRLPPIVGSGRALELIYTGDLINAEEAYRIGLINRIAPAGKALETALELARTISNRPALALSLVRRALRDARLQTIAEATERTLADSHAVFTGPDIAEGLDAFFEKRPPVFSAPRSNASSKD